MGLAYIEYFIFYESSLYKLQRNIYTFIFDIENYLSTFFFDEF